jgi:hypothetical protein
MSDFGVSQPEFGPSQYHPLRTFKLTHHLTRHRRNLTAPRTPSGKRTSQVKRRRAVYVRIFTAANTMRAVTIARRAPGASGNSPAWVVRPDAISIQIGAGLAVECMAGLSRGMRRDDRQPCCSAF